MGGGRIESHPISSPESTLNWEPLNPATTREKWVYMAFSCSYAGAERGMASWDVLGLCQTLPCAWLCSGP